VAICLHWRRQERQSLLTSQFRFMGTFVKTCEWYLLCRNSGRKSEQMKRRRFRRPFTLNQAILRTQPKVSGILPVWIPVKVSYSC